MHKLRKRGLDREFNRAGTFIGIVTLVLIQIILWCIVGAPMELFHQLRGTIPLLPRWLYMLLELAIHALLGAAIGAVLCKRRHPCEIQKYRGAFYFLLAILFGYLYFAFFFGIHFFLVSFILAVMEFLGLLVAMLNFSRVIQLAGLFSGIGCLWSFYKIFLSFFAFFGV